MLDRLEPLFEARLFDVPSTDDLFNPYRDRDDALDRPDAAAIRRDNLRRYAAAYDAPPPLLLLCEAPGPWGCRFTGVPITSEAQLLDPAFPLSGTRSSTADAAHDEYSASIFWRVLQPAFPHFFVWNTVPLHPHKPGRPLTIRTPRVREVKAHLELLAGVVEAVGPQRVLAVGRKAEDALARVGVAATYVRHPSQGGATRFGEGVREALRALGLADGG